MPLSSKTSISARAAIWLVATFLVISTPALGFLLPSNLNLLPRRAQGGGGGRGGRGGDSLAISRRFPRARWEVGVASAAQLQHVIELANATSTEGWAASQADSTNARDRDGTWVMRDEAAMEEMKKAVNGTFARPGAWGWLLGSPQPFTVPLSKTPGVEMRIVVIPTGQSLPPFEHPAGAVVLSKALVGACEVKQMLGNSRGKAPLREATRSLITSTATSLFLGGPCRIYAESTMEGPCAILEVALLPMLKYTGGSGFVEGDNYQEEVMELDLGARGAEDLLCDEREARMAAPGDVKEEEGEEEQGWTESEQGDGNDAAEITLEKMRRRVGGLDDQIATIVRRTLSSRKISSLTMKELGLKHVRGLLLYGPPGCGKTLIAREIARAMKSRPPKIVNGPEILDKWVGEAERNVRALFFDAESEWIDRGEESGLHVIILDEMDAFAKKRGLLRGDTTGVRDSVVNQLLAIMDGVREIDNFLVIGLTNRKDLIDPALLRPGRLEVHLEINAPEEEGRQEILEIHLRKLRNTGRLAEGVWDAIPEIAKKPTRGFTGAELAGLVRSAASFALERSLEEGGGQDGRQVMVSLSDMERALSEVRPARLGARGWLSKMLKAR